MPDYNGHLKDVLRTPKYSASIGLLREGRAQIIQGQEASRSKPLGSVMRRFRDWFAGNF